MEGVTLFKNEFKKKKKKPKRAEKDRFKIPALCLTASLSELEPFITTVSLCVKVEIMHFFWDYCDSKCFTNCFDVFEGKKTLSA